MLREDGRERADTAEADETHVGDLSSQFDALDAAIEALLATLATSDGEAAAEAVAGAPQRGGLIGLIGRYSIRGSADLRQESPVARTTVRMTDGTPSGEPATLEPDWL
jgi:hypothetical protein